MKSSNSYLALQQVLQAMKRAHLASAPADLKLRQDRLLRSINLIRTNYQRLTEAMNADFGHRSSYQSQVADLATTMKMLQHALENVPSWMKTTLIDAPEPGMQTRIQHQPLGVVGIISPWNFPINLAFGPLAGVFAAGNTAMLKPSELTPRTSELLAELVGASFGPDELEVVLGDAEVGQAFSALPFDHLIFTGSSAVGKHVMRAAAENLVPVTLELGGKSPVMIDTDADITDAVEKTLTVKTFNVGQICLSPDYVLLPEDKLADFIEASKRFVSQAFPSIADNPDYTSIINNKHYQRLLGLLQDAKNKGAQIISLTPAGEAPYNMLTRTIAPHLVIDVNDQMAIMQEEIFGPLLPIKTYTDRLDAIAYINANARPLAAYYFGNNPENQQHFSDYTTSGALVINDVMTHVSIDSLPFGGVGYSGIGAYHGEHGFKQFSHAKPVVIQSENNDGTARLRAPYADKQIALEALLKG
ncbi:coniferyl aldehyde dehydrogenase [Psychromonas antarctica]|uniref:coniferyl aldehyde dehydrogenase n=1 Tax=Psychromonas antarctica TaxID=67573 RepID=UPI001EE8498B|nr:coniferyl aldehyde dehydrogenase [Psychromonas antarctica]MCG6202527.1 coniferyl aldehyde dehydrogenase [Psychromonas antarctica]